MVKQVGRMKVLLLAGLRLTGYELYFGTRTKMIASDDPA